MGQKILLAKQEGVASAAPVDTDAIAGTGAPEASAPVEQIALRRPPHLLGVEVWSVGASARPWTMFHTTFAFCTLDRLDGRRSSYHRGRSHEIGTGTIMLFEPGELQVATLAEGEADLHVLLVSAATVREALAVAGVSPAGLHFEGGVVEDAAVAGQLRRLARSLELPVADPVEQRGLLQRFLAGVFARGAAQPQTIPASGCARAVDRTREILETKFAERITLDDVSRETSLSKFHLERSFHERVGLPIHQYLKKVRVAQACILLRTGLRPADVATRVGFADQPHMTRVFRDELGVTPRRLCAAGQPWPC
jgi:AraC-like DNA-binding protein